MAELTIPHTITDATNADASELQQNYQAIRDFINAQVVHRDGSIIMSGPLTLDGTEPSLGTDPVTKEYVDALGTSEATPNTIVRRDADGCIKVADPNSSTAAISKKYVDDRIGMDWTVVTPASGWSTSSLGDSAFSLRYKKINNIVYVSGALRRSSGGTAASGTTMATLPAGFRPPGSLVSSPGGLQVASNGQIKCGAFTSQGSTYSGSISFPVA